MSDAKSKISLFEQVQKQNKPEDWERKRQRAKFESKLNKFQGQGSVDLTSTSTSVNSVTSALRRASVDVENREPKVVRDRAKYFADVKAAHEEEKAAQERKISFDQMKHGFDQGEFFNNKSYGSL